jgi:hypothetical protein
MTAETVAKPPVERASTGDGAPAPRARRQRIRLRPALAEAAGQVKKAVVWLTLAVVAVIAVGIVFEVLEANDAKAIVSFVEDFAKWLAAPFDEMFTPHSQKLAIAVNWGIAIGVYAALGSLLAGAMERMAAAVR